ncbi:MAG TPA: cation-translocating P-type ATPase [Chitinophagaceae bacterium]|nr:cadmium-translocating P-type ATPase [Chitinophagaceae bacterium]MCC6635165.1 cadmium-translocating P-type ATPase [Chitinophagaceae bacterium]HNE92861.1 cation-translocating P-type ATPase [Chitinophagaceae bacterium]HNF29722.1 cation-translocating P-type ATPase [Chitinophagaceae bacterium]HNM33382.1 cation-translocating P-type ATPase [Chitinophagaceae bacterium]
MEKVEMKVEGMSCTNCALTIDKYLKEQGLQNVKVNFIGGDVSFDMLDNTSVEAIEKGIYKLGYTVKNDHQNSNSKQTYYGFLPFKNNLQRFWFCFVFTLPLMLHMIPFLHIHFLMNPYVQLGLTIPVYVVGMDFFARSAIKSMQKGIPNMNVLITIGSTAAFIYSLYGLLIGKAQDYLFFETAATTITLVFLGNYMEDKSVEQTQAALKKLAVSQKTMANMIAFDDKHEEQIFQVESKDLRVGDLVLIRNGEFVPMDCKILWGEAEVNEAIITGESIPVRKATKDKLIGGSIVEAGTVKAQITAVGQDTVLANILKMIKNAETEKPPVQQMADKISAIFVPTVVSIALLTLLINYFFASQTFAESLLRSIAVLVISCPCAMGLATPAAIAVGLGRGAKKGILFKNARSLEIFKSITQVVFDKTGTLTTGKFSIAQFHSTIDENDFKTLVYSLEKYSNHPIGKSIAAEWKTKNDIRWSAIEEVKGLGMKATDKEGNEFIAGSFKTSNQTTPQEELHNVYVSKNGKLIGWIDVKDELRPEAAQVVQILKQKGIKTILLSGDKTEKCVEVQKTLGIDEIIAEQTPEQKLQHIDRLNKLSPTAMVGDGINDGPALAKATVGISLSDASQVAMQSAQVVLMNHGLKNLPEALGLGKHTYITIKENLFWAFSYNIVAIPVAALGFLSPTFGALIMGLSDVVLAVNSLRLKWKKVM